MKKVIAIVTAVAALGATAVAAGPAQASSSCWYSPRGCVSVSGYYKPSTGTYVSPYYRNYPGYRTPSYRTPSYRTPSYGSYSYRPGGSSYGGYGSSYSY
jgi:hypothetical protein